MEILKKNIDINKIKIYIGSKEKNRFNKFINNDLIEIIFDTFLIKSKYVTYIDKEIIDHDYYFNSFTYKTYKYKLIHHLVYLNNFFIESYHITNVPNINLNLKRNYNNEYENTIHKLIVTEKINIINRNNEIYLEVIKDSEWDNTYKYLLTILNTINDIIEN